MFFHCKKLKYQLYFSDNMWPWGSAPREDYEPIPDAENSANTDIEASPDGSKANIDRLAIDAAVCDLVISLAVMKIEASEEVQLALLERLATCEMLGKPAIILVQSPRITYIPGIPNSLGDIPDNLTQWNRRSVELGPYEVSMTWNMYIFRSPRLHGVALYSPDNGETVIVYRVPRWRRWIGF
jgi:hypothetical protein